MQNLLALASVFLRIQPGKRRNHTRPEPYGYTVKSLSLPTDGTVEYAQWLHPKDTPHEVLQSEVDALRQFIREGDTVIDIGAYSGDTTVPMALAAGPSGCTFAVEPNPHVFPVLEKNAALNPEKTNIIPLCMAATAEDGEFVFHYSDGGYCNGGKI